MIKEVQRRLGTHTTTETVLTVFKEYRGALDKLDKIKIALAELKGREVFVKNEKGELERIFIIQI